MSVLTEPTRFDGSLEHLRLASRALAARGGVPAMRKDFLVHPYQLAEARLAGAGGMLIILRMLARAREPMRCWRRRRSLKLFVLAEAFDEADIAMAHDICRAPMARELRAAVGVNSRDLVTLKVVPGRLEMLAGGLPRRCRASLKAASPMARMRRAWPPPGYDIALVGSALMTSSDPPALLREMLRAGRRAR